MTLPIEIYIENHLIPELLAGLVDEELISYSTEHATALDGFMSNLYNINLKTKTEKGVKERSLIAKFMRGDVAFRESSKSYIQFANEIHIYSNILPEYQKFLKDLNITNLQISDLVPNCYKAKFGYIEGLSSSATEKECVLVLENLKPLGYQLGPRLTLNSDHLLAMCKLLGQFHALSYALRVLKPFKWNSLKSDIITLPFINDNDPKDATTNVYRVLYRVAFDRLYDFYDRKIDTNIFDKKSVKDLKLIECLSKIREKYFEEPARLMEKLRTKFVYTPEDLVFGVILHGDYNRNNVLFKYKSAAHENNEGDFSKNIEAIQMVDFQQLRYASPCLDLSFFMYFNCSEDIRSDIWLELLQTYHSQMYSTLSSLLNASQMPQAFIAEILENYSFEKFQLHFSRFAFFGAMICLNFLPWMLCSEEECRSISKLFESDLHGEEFHTVVKNAGGDEVNMRLLSILKHACDMGYMDDL